MSIQKNSQKKISLKAIIAITTLTFILFGLSGCTYPVTCGDSVCSQKETVLTCTKDCASCGDGYCLGEENVANCPRDCAVCGDGNCTGHEANTNCPQDCRSQNLAAGENIPEDQNLTAQKNPSQLLLGDTVKVNQQVPFVESTKDPSTILLMGEQPRRYLKIACALLDSNLNQIAVMGAELRLPRDAYGDIEKTETAGSHVYVYANWKNAGGNIIASGIIDDTNGNCLSRYPRIIPQGTIGTILSSVPQGSGGTQPTYANGNDYWLVEIKDTNTNNTEISWIKENALEKTSN